MKNWCIRYNKALIIFVTCLALGLVLAGCASQENPYEGREPSDISGYAGMSGHDEAVMLVDTNMDEVKRLMDDEQSFVLYAGYDTCPFCNRLIPYLNEVAADQDIYIGYLDTRKDPAWESNLDIDGYDTFLELFGEYLDKDEDGKLHLYTPDVYFVKRGKVVARHYGVVDGADDPDKELTTDQEQELRKQLAKEFKRTGL